MNPGKIQPSQGNFRSKRSEISSSFNNEETLNSKLEDDDYLDTDNVIGHMK